MTYSLASAAALCLSSSLYFVAAIEVYFVLGFWFARAAVPPFDWKNFVADSLPPTFMVRSWSHCHSAYPLHHYSDSWEVRMIKAYGQGLLIWQMKYELLDCGDLRSNPGTGIYRTAPKTRLGFWFRSQSIPKIYQRSRLDWPGKGHAYFVRRFCLQFLEDFLWLGFCSRAHVGEKKRKIALKSLRKKNTHAEVEWWAAILQKID